jgi:lysyl-tRNA synthetase class 2
MDFVEDLYNYVAVKVLGTTLINYQGNEIDLKKPWKRISMYDALKKYAEIDVEKLSDDDIRELLNENKIEFADELSRGLLIAELFKIVEPKLIQPIFIIDHPRETTPLCKDHREKPGLIERFEPYINGWEVGNAYSELNDPVKQRFLLEEQAEQLKEGFEEGLPPMGGLGIGIDRMIMLFTNSTSIRDVIFFPTMKPEE